MPELPEVETIRRGLEPKAVGRVVERAELRLPKLARDGSLPWERLRGARITAVRRRGKHLLVDFTGGLTLAVHLGMSGQLTFWDHTAADAPGFMRHRHTGLQKTPTQHAPDRHTHFLLHLRGGDRIQYRDPRQFGRLRLLATPKVAATPPFDALGPEPFDPALTPAAFRAALAAHRTRLKPLLLDQRVIAGVGNIYADEALFGAGLHPLTPAAALTLAQAGALLASIRGVLRQGIENGGSSIADFIGADGAAGANQERLRVYGRGGERCVRCGAELVRTLVAQRGTVHCPRCQPAPARLGQRVSRHEKGKARG